MQLLPMVSRRSVTASNKQRIASGTISVSPRHLSNVQSWPEIENVLCTSNRLPYLKFVSRQREVRGLGRSAGKGRLAGRLSCLDMDWGSMSYMESDDCGLLRFLLLLRRRKETGPRRVEVGVDRDQKSGCILDLLALQKKSFCFRV